MLYIEYNYLLYGESDCVVYMECICFMINGESDCVVYIECFSFMESLTAWCI